jgi:hypothetical protein
MLRYADKMVRGAAPGPVREVKGADAAANRRFAATCLGNTDPASRIGAAPCSLK